MDGEISNAGKGMGKKKIFRWTDEMQVALIECLSEYKTKCEFNNIDFDADKACQYQRLREEMAARFPCDENNGIPFGPVQTTPFFNDARNTDEIQSFKAKLKIEQKQISQGYSRILEKVKSVRQGFSRAIISGTRSGSGRLICDQYEMLKSIWGGSANTEPLKTGIESSELNEHVSNFVVTDKIEMEPEERECENHTDFQPVPLEEDLSEEGTSTSTSSTDIVLSKPCSSRVVLKRKQSLVPKLIDNKRKHMERRLSAAQRDALLLEETKDDKFFRKEVTQAIKESSLSIAKAIGDIGQSMAQANMMMARSMELIAQSMNMPDQSYNYQPFSKSGNMFQRMYYNNRLQTEGNNEQHSRNMNFSDIFKDDTQSSF